MCERRCWEGGAPGQEQQQQQQLPSCKRRVGYTGDSSDESDPDLKSSACKHLPPAAVDDAWLSTDDTSTTRNQMSSGRGTPTDGAGGAVGVLASPASSSLPEPSARDSAADFSARKKSLLRCVGKPYARWQIGNLRFACPTRGIARMTREKDAHKMTELLQAGNVEDMMITSPNMDNLWGDNDEGEEQVHSSSYTLKRCT